MQQLDLLELTYESDSHGPQLLVSLSERGSAALEAIIEDGLKNRNQYLGSLSAEKRMELAAALRSSWLDGFGIQPGLFQPGWFWWLESLGV
jgi:hypothetical protein